MKETLPHTIDKLFWNIAVNDDENAFKTLFFPILFSPSAYFAHRYIERWETCEDDRTGIFSQNLGKQKKYQNRNICPQFFGHKRTQ